MPAATQGPRHNANRSAKAWVACTRDSRKALLIRRLVLGGAAVMRGSPTESRGMWAILVKDTERHDYGHIQDFSLLFDQQEYATKCSGRQCVFLIKGLEFGHFHANYALM